MNIYQNIKKIKNNIQTEISKHEKISRFLKEWNDIMAESGAINKSYLVISPKGIKIENYGFSMKLVTPHGLNFELLEKLKPNIEDGIGCIFIYEKVHKTDNMVECKIITKQIKEVKFAPIKLQPYELYLGTGLDGKPYIVNMLKYPHLLDTGATGMGKTKLIDCALTNLICSCNPSDIGLYLMQVDKCDQIVYRRCKHTRAYANTLMKVLGTSNYILKILKHRTQQISSMIEDGNGDNIFDYNKFNITNPWSYIYVVIDEYASLMPNNIADSKNIKYVKSAIQYNIERIAQIGRSCGVYLIIGLQRATKDKLPPFAKAMMNISVSFKQTNSISSLVAIDTEDATSLNPREAIVKTNSMDFIKTATLTQKMIVNFIDNYRIPKNIYKDSFNYEYGIEIREKSSKNTKKSRKNQEKSVKFKENNDKFDKVDPLKAKENINKIKLIPNFVPYNPRQLKKLNIIDKTKIPATAPLSKNPQKGDINNEDFNK